MKSDIEIARGANKQPIQVVGEKVGIPAEHLIPYGHDKAKVTMAFIEKVQSKEDGKLILVTAINPTRSEEHTSELQSLMRISYAVFCLNKKLKQQIYEQSI